MRGIYFLCSLEFSYPVFSMIRMQRCFFWTDRDFHSGTAIMLITFAVICNALLKKRFCKNIYVMQSFQCHYSLNVLYQQFYRKGLYLFSKTNFKSFNNPHKPSDLGSLVACSKQVMPSCQNELKDTVLNMELYHKWCQQNKTYGYSRQTCKAL